MKTKLPTLTRGAEPFFYKAGNVGCLCLHGFTASPDEMRWFGHALAQEGITTYGPRMVGHGVDYHDMARMRWHDWYLSALDGYHLLRQHCDQVFVGGLSMGGLMTIMVASAVPVSGAIVMAAPLINRDRMFEATHLLKYVLRYTKQPDISELPKRIQAEQARRNMPVVGRVRYLEWSTSAVAELHKAMLTACDCLPDVTAPVLAIFSKGDKTVPPANADFLQRTVGSKIVERHDLEKSDHVMTQDVEADTIFELAADFIKRHSQPMTEAAPKKAVDEPKPMTEEKKPARKPTTRRKKTSDEN
jgi:carboxylesterase